MSRQVVFLIYSRGRIDNLHRLLTDLWSELSPALEGFDFKVCVYAQYGKRDLDRLTALDWSHLIVHGAQRRFKTIGEVVRAATISFTAEIEASDVVVMMDDDTIYNHHPLVNQSWRDCLSVFIENGDLVNSFRLGFSTTYARMPLVTRYAPFISGKEKMQWLAPSVLLEAVANPLFAKLGLGEDVALNAFGWQRDPSRCWSIDGFGTLYHLGCEPFLEIPIDGGLKSLIPDAHRDRAYDYLAENFASINELFPGMFERSGAATDWRYRIGKGYLETRLNGG